MTRKPKNAIMVRSKLRNTFLKHPTNENKRSYRKQNKVWNSIIDLMVENKELKLTTNIVPLKKYYLECLRVLLWGLYS